MCVCVEGTAQCGSQTLTMQAVETVSQFGVTELFSSWDVIEPIPRDLAERDLLRARVRHVRVCEGKQYARVILLACKCVS